jgi:hypothetical protein
MDVDGPMASPRIQVFTGFTLTVRAHQVASPKILPKLVLEAPDSFLRYRSDDPNSFRATLAG